MASIIKKKKGGKAYYYAVKSKRVDGKPRIVWQKYLGSVDAILQQFEQTAAPTPLTTTLFEAGGVAALLQVANQLNITDLIDEVIPKRSQGPSVAHYILLAAINRALAPESKSQVGDWYKETSLQRLWEFSADAFSSQNFWNHMDMVSEENIDQIQTALTLRVKDRFSIDTKSILYDTTNFFTYIDSFNEKNTIAQRGKNKQKRSDLRQINLALLTTQEFQIPLFHKVYDGNCPDVKFFPEILKELFQKQSLVSLSDVTIAFDKGNLTEETLERLLYSKLHFVSGMKEKLFPEIFSTPLSKFHDVPTLPGTKVYEEEVEVHGKRCKIAMCHSEGLSTQQLASVTAGMARCQNQLHDLQQSLVDRAKKNLRASKEQIEQRLKDILSAQHMKDLFVTNLSSSNGVCSLKYSTNYEALQKIINERFGRTLLLTNRTEWLPIEIVTCYRNLSTIEDAFKHMKNRDYLRWQPAFHWTDQKIKVHSLCCVIAFLLVTLARKMAFEAGIELSIGNLLDDLTSIREVVLLYPAANSNKSVFTISQMTSRQRKLADLFKIGDLLGMPNPADG